ASYDEISMLCKRHQMSCSPNAVEDFSTTLEHLINFQRWVIGSRSDVVKGNHGRICTPFYRDERSSPGGRLVRRRSSRWSPRTLMLCSSSAGWIGTSTPSEFSVSS